LPIKSVIQQATGVLRASTILAGPWRKSRIQRP
jgi:hypothetical protein